MILYGDTCTDAELQSDFCATERIQETFWADERAPICDCIRKQKCISKHLALPPSGPDNYGHISWASRKNAHKFCRAYAVLDLLIFSLCFFIHLILIWLASCNSTLQETLPTYWKPFSPHVTFLSSSDCCVVTKQAEMKLKPEWQSIRTFFICQRRWIDTVGEGTPPWVKIVSQIQLNETVKQMCMKNCITIMNMLVAA